MSVTDLCWRQQEAEEEQAFKYARWLLRYHQLCNTVNKNTFENMCVLFVANADTERVTERSRVTKIELQETYILMFGTELAFGDIVMPENQLF